ncbi:MAG: protoporphyrinogen oxidase HemJ [Leptolyngbyaceae cyanobacterium HOT.MB2.61]|jgi:putative membrane protein|nr:protoporphyrinogen oxidase HemJ [Leptolyngbyaceae cyanobacterium HOT.MB2.61]
MAYYWYKAFHIVGFVTWFAGLFYLVRLFVYHAEANDKPEPARSILKEQYELMEKRLYNIITTPGMLLTVAMAIGLVSTETEILKQPWLHVKIGLVLLLIGYHHYCKRIMKQLAAGECKITAQQFRWLNEAPTIFLVVIVMLAIFKNNLPTDLTTYVVAGMVVAFAVSIQLYARKRRLDKERAEAEANELVSTVSSGGSAT